MLILTQSTCFGEAAWELFGMTSGQQNVGGHNISYSIVYS